MKKILITIISLVMWVWIVSATNLNQDMQEIKTNLIQANTNLNQQDLDSMISFLEELSNLAR